MSDEDPRAADYEANPNLPDRFDPDYWQPEEENLRQAELNLWYARHPEHDPRVDVEVSSTTGPVVPLSVVAVNIDEWDV